MAKVIVGSLLGGLVGIIVAMLLAYALSLTIVPKWLNIVYGPHAAAGLGYPTITGIYCVAGLSGFFGGAITGALASATSVIVHAIKETRGPTGAIH